MNDIAHIIATEIATKLKPYDVSLYKSTYAAFETLEDTTVYYIDHIQKPGWLILSFLPNHITITVRMNQNTRTNFYYEDPESINKIAEFIKNVINATG